MNEAAIRKKMEELNETILKADTSVAGGAMVNLSSLDREIETLCKHAVRLPPPQARELQPLMAELIGNLERLAMTLKEYKENLKR